MELRSITVIFALCAMQLDRNLTIMSITIPANRKRFPIVFIISFLLTVGGAYNITSTLNDSDEQLSYWTYGILLIPLFYCIVSFIEFVKTQFNKNAVLQISDIGVNDNLSIFSCGKIPWSDISDVDIKKAFSASFLVMKLFDNNKYLREKNFITRYVLNKWIKKWGSPIIISEKRINYDLIKLRDIILKQKE